MPAHARCPLRLPRGQGVELVTQMHAAGEPQNERDRVLGRIDPTARAGVIVALSPDDSIEKRRRSQFDIVMTTDA